jgi:general secretion pathway protein I
MRRRGGFTLLEVMIALGILAGALVVLLRISTQDVRAAYHAKLLTIGTQLARSKMADIEADLYKNLFSCDEQSAGDFTDEGQPKFAWEATCEKVVLPTSDSVTTSMGGQQNAANPSAPTQKPEDANQEALMNLAGGSTSGALGAGMVQMYFPLISPILENAIRKVTLTIKWKAGGEADSMTIICFFTDTKAIDLAMPGAAAAAAASGTTPATTGGPSGTGTGTPSTAPTPVPRRPGP